jgi:ADP-heptose:LPS heptosyltransferase
MKIVVLHAGGLGDLVLVETLLASLRERYAGAHVTLVVRESVAAVAALYATPPDAVRVFAFDPYRWALPIDAAIAIEPFLTSLALGPVDLFIAAELKSTWLGEIMAAFLAPKRAILCDARIAKYSEVRQLLGLLGLHRNMSALRPAAVDSEHELDRYARLAETSRRAPMFRALESARSQNDDPRIVVFAAGSPELKRWPDDAMRAALTRIAARYGARLVLVGSAAEREELEALAAASDPSASWTVECGTASDLTRIAALIAGAIGYVAIDTGLAHLAAAYGVPGITIYGGGTWPSYAPWGRASAGVVAPLPCFRCFWDCAFDRAFCIERIGPDSVVVAFEEAIARSREESFVNAVEPYTKGERDILGAASAVYRAAQADRAARLTAIVRMKNIWHRNVQRVVRRQVNMEALRADPSHVDGGGVESIRAED